MAGVQLLPTPLTGVYEWPGLSEYDQVWQAMKDFTDLRNEDSRDQIWLVEHLPVYTLGQAGRTEHVLNPSAIPIVKTDRGGQVTYHGPGQVVAYVLADLRRMKVTVRDMVNRLESAVISTLQSFGIGDACRKPGAPGVYVPWDQDLAKIAALGLKVRKGCTYHGVSLNVDMDLSPFEGIDPCGYKGLKTVSMASCGTHVSWEEVALMLAGNIIRECGVRVE